MKAASQSLSSDIVSDSRAAAGVAPLAARSDKFTATSFQPTLVGEVAMVRTWLRRAMATERDAIVKLLIDAIDGADNSSKRKLSKALNALLADVKARGLARLAAERGKRQP